MEFDMSVYLNLGAQVIQRLVATKGRSMSSSSSRLSYPWPTLTINNVGHISDLVQFFSPGKDRRYKISTTSTFFTLFINLSFWHKDILSGQMQDIFTYGSSTWTNVRYFINISKNGGQCRTISYSVDKGIILN